MARKGLSQYIHAYNASALSKFIYKNIKNLIHDIVKAKLYYYVIVINVCNVNIKRFLRTIKRIFEKPQIFINVIN